MLKSIVSLQQENSKKPEKLMKIVNIEEENLQIFWTSWGISMKFKKKDVTYDKIKPHKNPGRHPFSGKHLFWKNTRVRGVGGRRSNWPPTPYLNFSFSIYITLDLNTDLLNTISVSSLTVTSITKHKLTNARNLCWLKRNCGGNDSLFQRITVINSTVSSLCF